MLRTNASKISRLKKRIAAPLKLCDARLAGVSGLNEPVKEVYHFVVGQIERSEVRIEKLRKQLFGHRNCVYVGGRLANVFVGI